MVKLCHITNLQVLAVAAAALPTAMFQAAKVEEFTAVAAEAAKVATAGVLAAVVAAVRPQAQMVKVKVLVLSVVLVDLAALFTSMFRS